MEEKSSPAQFQMIYKCLVICCKYKPYFFYQATLHSNILTANLAIDFEAAAEYVSVKLPLVHQIASTNGNSILLWHFFTTAEFSIFNKVLQEAVKVTGDRVCTFKSTCVPLYLRCVVIVFYYSKVGFFWASL